MRALVLTSIVAFAGCIHDVDLVPAPSAARVEGVKRAAYADVGGVHVTVRSDSWRGSPRDLEYRMTPLEISIENSSGRSLRLVYENFELITKDGVHLSAIPPYNLDQDGPAARTEPSATVTLVDDRGPRRHRIEHRRFRVAPYYGRYYPGIPSWDLGMRGNWSWPYYGAHYADWPQALPTEDMLDEALPEGSLESDGFVRGFVYFPTIKQKQGNVTFSVKMVDAETGESFGTVQIPFTVI